MLQPYHGKAERHVYLEWQKKRKWITCSGINSLSATKPPGEGKKITISGRCGRHAP